MTDTEETKSGARHSAADMQMGRKVKAMAGEIASHMDALGFTDPVPPAEWNAADANEKAVIFGMAVKALGDGRVGGYLVRFSDEQAPDLTGDFFTPTTDFGEHETAPVLYQHGLDDVLKGRVLGKGKLKKDDVGVWIDAQLNLRDEYEKAVYALAEQGKLGWSSGTAAHLVERAPAGKARFIKSWPLGLDASLTPTPAEPRNAAMTLKAYVDSLQPAVQPASNGAENPSTVPVTEQVPVQPKEIDPMEAEQFEKIMAAVTGIKAEVDAMKAAPAERTPGVAGKTAEMLAAEQGPAIKTSPKEKLADEQLAAMREYLNRAIGPEERKAWDNHNARVAAAQPELAAAFKAFIHNPESRDARLQYENAQKATLIEGTASLGGYLVPQQYTNTVVGTLKEASILRRAGSYQFNVAGTNLLNVTTITRSASAPLVTEKTISAQAEPTFGSVGFVPYAYRSLYIASREAVVDTRVPLESILMENASWQLTQSENNHFAIGTGSGQPQGFAAAASTLGLSPGSTLALAFPDGRAGGDLIADVYHGLPYQYRDNAVWFASDTVIKTIRKLRDGSGAAASIGNFLWQPGLQAGQPDRLMGRPIYPLNNMATSGSTANVLVFGDPRFFWIADFNNGGLDFMVLNELYAASMSVGYTFWKRFDSHLVVSEAAVGVKLLS